MTGIEPFNPNVFGDHEFLASSVTDRPEPVVNTSQSLSTVDPTSLLLSKVTVASSQSLSAVNPTSLLLSSITVASSNSLDIVDPTASSQSSNNGIEPSQSSNNSIEPITTSIDFVTPSRLSVDIVPTVYGSSVTNHLLSLENSNLFQKQTR